MISVECLYYIHDRFLLLHGQKRPSVKQFPQLRAELHHFVVRKKLRHSDPQTAADGLQRWDRRRGVPPEDVQDRGFRQFGLFGEPILAPAACRQQRPQFFMRIQEATTSLDTILPFFMVVSYCISVMNLPFSLAKLSQEPL